MAGDTEPDRSWGWWVAIAVGALLWWQNSQDEPEPPPPAIPTLVATTSSLQFGGPTGLSGDLDCADLPGPVRVTGADPHGLDRDGDGIGCEANG